LKIATCNPGVSPAAIDALATRSTSAPIAAGAADRLARMAHRFGRHRATVDDHKVVAGRCQRAHRFAVRAQQAHGDAIVLDIGEVEERQQLKRLAMAVHAQRAGDEIFGELIGDEDRERHDQAKAAAGMKGFVHGHAIPRFWRKRKRAGMDSARRYRHDIGLRGERRSPRDWGDDMRTGRCGG